MSGSATDILDPSVRSAIWMLARNLRRLGIEPEAVVHEFQQAFEHLAQEVQVQPAAVERELPEAPHVMTLWHHDVAYVDEDGQPRKLRRQGREPSFEALVRRVDPNLNADRVLEYLMRDRVVGREGAWYRPQKRGVVLATTAGPAAFRTVRVLAAVLRTFEHNLLLSPSDRLQRWFERICENPHFPISRIEEFAALLERHGTPFLNVMDSFMHACEAARDPDEPTTKLGVGVFRYQENHDVER